MIDVDLSARLRDAYDLQHAVVVDTPDDNPTTLREHLGNAAAELLSEIVTADDVLGLAWSRSVSAMTNALNRLPAIPVVQLTGALVQPDMADSSVDLVRQAARISGGAAHFFYAPAVVPDPATARALRKQPDVARTFGRFGSVTKAVVGVGLWAPGDSTVYDVTDKKLQRELHQRGVCGEIAGVLIDADGYPAESDLTERMIGISAAQLRAIPEVIGLAYGIARSPAVQAAVRGGFIKSLVTHPSLARALLAQPENQSLPDPPERKT
jgi:DNA-binding transcriptional regulator LsrR (DeoR family)